MNKLYIAVFLIAALIAYDKWRFSNAFEQGYNTHKAEMADKKDDADKADKKAVKELIVYKDKEKVVYRDKIKYIKLAKDPTGCADTKLTDMGFGL